MRDGQLVFHGPPGFRRGLETAEFERAVREGRGDRVYWNGPKRSATHRPGEVVCVMSRRKHDGGAVKTTV